MSSRRGRSLEKLVARIETILAGSKNVSVESPKRLEDRITGRSREHDVVLSIQQGHHNLTISIECRDRKTKVGTPQVEGFWKKCQDTGIDQGIIVSSNGFSGPALKKAAMLGIRCISLEQALSFQWLLASGLHSEQQEIIHTSWTVVPVDQALQDRISDFQLVDEQGQQVSNATLNANISKTISMQPRPEGAPTEYLVDLEFSGEGILIREMATGEIHATDKLLARSRIRITRDHSPFKLFRYEDIDSDTHLGEVATARIEAGEMTGNLVLVRGPDGGTSISFVPDRDD